MSGNNGISYGMGKSDVAGDVAGGIAGTAASGQDLAMFPHRKTSQ